MTSRIIKIAAPPAIDVQSDGNGGVIIVITSHNHPIDGTRLHFPREVAGFLLDAFHQRLTCPGETEFFPGDVKAHLRSREVESGDIQLVMTLDAWKGGSGKPPVLLFDRKSGAKMYHTIAKACGRLLLQCLPGS